MYIFFIYSNFFLFLIWRLFIQFERKAVQIIFDFFIGKKCYGIFVQKFILH